MLTENRKCNTCGNSLKNRRIDAEFCSDKCRVLANQRAKNQKTPNAELFSFINQKLARLRQELASLKAERADMIGKPIFDVLCMNVMQVELRINDFETILSLLNP